MGRQYRWTLLLGFVVLGGCTLTPRRPPPPNLINDAAPVGFSPDIRLLTTNRRQFIHDLPQFLQGLRQAAGSKPVNALVLSGGGADGAFGAGALIGLARAHKLPKFTFVSGVSAGALLAPFAFLGPKWDSQLKRTFEGEDLEHLQRATGTLATLGRFLFAGAADRHDPLVQLVDRNFSNAMIDAVGRQAATGRILMVATTDLDDQETMLWNMGAIAEQGGAAAHALFRKVLVASASVPGIFPPVLIAVRDRSNIYDEMHVDGSVTTPLFIAPLIAQTVSGKDTAIEGAKVYVIVNGKLATRPKETPVNTLKILEYSSSAQITYKTRDALGLVMALSHRDHMQFSLTDIPMGYPSGNFLDFDRRHLQQLFAYGEACAAEGLLWASPEQTIHRDLYRNAKKDESLNLECPAAVFGASQ